MCGRFNVIDSPGLQQLLRDLGLDISLPTRVNLAPTEQVSLVTSAGGARALKDARWWLTPSWAPAVDQKYSMFNARSENLAKSRAFRQPFRTQRGLVPMSSFIEWRTEGSAKQPWLIGAGDAAMAIAALWDVWDKGDTPLLSCTLVTTAAAPEFRPWHGRMPVLLSPDEYDRWLDNARELPADDPVFRSELKMPLQLVPIARAVGNARNKDPRLLEPAGEPVALPG